MYIFIIMKLKYYFRFITKPIRIYLYLNGIFRRMYCVYDVGIMY